MHDRNISLHHVAAAALWTVGATLIILGLLHGVAGLGHLGLLSAGLGGVINIRGFICYSTEREHNAFLIGRDSVGVRSIR